MEKKKEPIAINIGLVGASTVGKTTMINKFHKKDFNYMDTVSTLGMDKRQITVNISENEYKVTIWDPAGQDKFELLTNNYIMNLDGIMLVFDTTELPSYEKVDKWIY